MDTGALFIAFLFIFAVFGLLALARGAHGSAV
jgi:hypothetical protein